MIQAEISLAPDIEYDPARQKIVMAIPMLIAVLLNRSLTVSLIASTSYNPRYFLNSGRYVLDT